MEEESEIKFLDLKSKTKRRSSFFGFEQTPVPESTQKEEEEAYYKKLEKEKNDWAEVLKNYNKKFRTYWNKEKVAVYDKTCLSKERQDYLAKAIDMEKYLKESEEFNKRVNTYVMQKQWLNRRYEAAIEDVEDLVTEQFYIKLN